MRIVRAIAAVAWLLAPCALAAPALAQFIPPPPPPPVLPPNYQQQQIQRPLAGSRCSTPAGICILRGAGALGSPCTCAGPTGAIPGRIVR